MESVKQVIEILASKNRSIRIMENMSPREKKDALIKKLDIQLKQNALLRSIK